MRQAVQILGIRFFNGSVDKAVEAMSQRGGFMIAPSGTCFARLERDADYRSAVTQADLAIADSGAMVLLWKLRRFQALTRTSGLRYLRQLIKSFAESGAVRILCVVPNEQSRDRTARWLQAQGSSAAAAQLYVAPFYARPVEDSALVQLIEATKPDHIVVGIGSGPQEKLGLYLRDHLSYRPAIHCTGAALGFLTGDQVAIPNWADRLYLGWLFRLFAQPRIFIPRLTLALRLPWLIFRYGAALPPLGVVDQKSKATG